MVLGRVWVGVSLCQFLTQLTNQFVVIFYERVYVHGNINFNDLHFTEGNQIIGTVGLFLINESRNGRYFRYLRYEKNND